MRRRRPPVRPRARCQRLRLCGVRASAAAQKRALLSLASDAPAARCTTCAPAARRHGAHDRFCCASLRRKRAISCAHGHACAGACSAGRQGASTRPLHAVLALLIAAQRVLLPCTGAGCSLLRAGRASAPCLNPKPTPKALTGLSRAPAAAQQCAHLRRTWRSDTRRVAHLLCRCWRVC